MPPVSGYDEYGTEFVMDFIALRGGEFKVFRRLSRIDLKHRMILWYFKRGLIYRGCYELMAAKFIILFGQLRG